MYNGSATLQPGEGIDGLPLDPQLEIQPGLPGERLAHGPDRLAPLDAAPAAHSGLEQVPIQAEILCTVVDNDQVAEAGEGARKGDRALVDGVNRRALVGRDLDAIGRRAGGAESGSNGPRRRPVELAAERPERQRLHGRSGAGGRFAQGGLEPLLRHVELAGQLSVEVAPAIDVGQKRVASRDRTLRGGLRSRRLCTERRELRAARRELDARRLERRKALLVRQNPIAIAALDRRDHARGLRQLPRIGGGHQQAQVPAPAELIEIDEASLNGGTLRDVLGFEASDLDIERLELGRRRRGLRFDAFELFGFDLALDLEPPKVAEQRTRLRGQAVGLLLQHPQTIAGTTGHRFGALATRRLRSGHGGRGHQASACGEAQGRACGQVQNNNQSRTERALRALYHVMCGNYNICRVSFRVLGIDVGRRRIGLAISDRSRTLARPLTTLHVQTATAVDVVGREIDRLAAEEDGLAEIIVGLPVRLDGSPNDETPRVAAFVDALRLRTSLPVRTGDERLTSHEAESRLALHERDWRKRKARLDAAAAAIILQDYLDGLGT